MASLSERMLAGGCALHVEAIHGEQVEILDGTDAGKFFAAVREVESDQILSTELGIDPRAKIFLRFIGNPAIGMTGRVKTDDGSIWNAVRRPEGAFLTNDYELTEVTNKDS